ncbi:MAG: hypothetical protein PHR73_03615 [Candidatus Omnitrophica bacterium]|nr:hypothetical protein [Candidatus Omnitrophota bacterium]
MFGYRLFSFLFVLTLILSGCASVAETAKGFAGISTKVLEEGRSQAVRNEYAVGYSVCRAKVKEVLKDTGSYIYADKPEKSMIAVYVTREDTTPAGIFFKELDKEKTLVEVSSPSTYAKELIAKRIYDYFNPAIKEPDSSAVK